MFFQLDLYQVQPDQDGANLDTPDLDNSLLHIVMDSIRLEYSVLYSGSEKEPDTPII